MYTSRVFVLLGLGMVGLSPAVTQAQTICPLVNGATIIAQDGKSGFLGKITNPFDSDSIFNDFGKYGNDFSPDSLWNEFSEYGNEFNQYSPFNEYSSKPPMIIKGGKVVGFLSSNKSIRDAISPNLLKALCKDNL